MLYRQMFHQDSVAIIFPCFRKGIVTLSGQILRGFKKK